MCAPTTAAPTTLDAQLLLKVAGPLAGTTQTPSHVTSPPSNLGVTLTPLTLVDAGLSARVVCLSSQSESLWVDKPIRAAQTAWTQRDRWTQVLLHHIINICWNAPFKWKAKLCPPPKAPAGPSVQPQGGSASPRTVLFTVGSPPKSSTPPTCSHLGTRPRTTSGENTSARVSKKSGLCSEATRFLIKLLHPSSLSGLQQLSRIAVLHQRSGLCGISSEHGHWFLPSRRIFGWADDAWSWRGAQQPAICPVWDLTSQLGRIHHLRSPWAPWRNPHGGEQCVLLSFHGWLEVFVLVFIMNSPECLSGTAWTHRHSDAPSDDALLHWLRPGDGGGSSRWGRARGLGSFPLPSPGECGCWPD